MFVTDFLKKSTTSVVFNFKLKKQQQNKKQSKTKQNKTNLEKKKKVVN